MGYNGSSDFKSRLVSEICSVPTASVGCHHRRYSNSGFIDWYRLLGVEENAGLDLVRKQYHKLALQLHPDKNKHPNAEIAFKLVSQAYVCLSDSSKRIAFGMERQKNFCIKCNKIPYHTNYDHSHISSTPLPKPRTSSTASWSRFYRFSQSFNDMKERFQEEAKIIENCLKTVNINNITGPKKESPVFGSSDYIKLRTRTETRIFHQSDYVLHGHPHFRTRKSEYVRCMQRGNLQGRRYDSPVYEIRSDFTVLFRNKSTCVYS